MHALTCMLIGRFQRTDLCQKKQYPVHVPTTDVHTHCLDIPTQLLIIMLQIYIYIFFFYNCKEQIRRQWGNCDCVQCSAESKTEDGQVNIVNMKICPENDSPSDPFVHGYPDPVTQPHNLPLCTDCIPALKGDLRLPTYSLSLCSLFFGLKD